MPAISSIEWRRKEWEFLRDAVGRLVTADRPHVEIHSIAEVRYGRVREDTGHNAQGHIGDIVVRSPAVRPAGSIRCRIAAGVMGQRAEPLLTGSLGWRDVQVDSDEIGERFIGLSRAADRWARRIPEQSTNEIFAVRRWEAGAEDRIEGCCERRVAIKRDKIILIFRIRGIPLVLHARRNDQLINEWISHPCHLDEAGAVVTVAVFLDHADLGPARAGIGADEFVAVWPRKVADGDLQRDRVDVETAERVGGAGTRRSNDNRVVRIVGIRKDR